MALNFTEMAPADTKKMVEKCMVGILLQLPDNNYREAEIYYIGKNDQKRATKVPGWEIISKLLTKRILNGIRKL